MSSASVELTKRTVAVFGPEDDRKRQHQKNRMRYDCLDVQGYDQMNNERSARDRARCNSPSIPGDHANTFQ